MRACYERRYYTQEREVVVKCQTTAPTKVQQTRRKGARINSCGGVCVCVWGNRNVGYPLTTT